jgi:peptidoglycan/LPS O-acetylase OafA/YrhL
MRQPQLDGLRFFLFLCIFLHHQRPEKLEWLAYSLPAFFVLSGFLITHVLVSAGHPTLLGKLRAFYARRTIRIFPAYYAVVAALIAFSQLSYPIYYVLYVMNFKLYWMSAAPTLRFARWFLLDWRHEAIHLWSLCVEEQFYLLYPLLLYLTPARHRTRMLVGVAIAGALVRIWFIRTAPNTFYGALLPVCAEYFAWGCLLGWLQHQGALARLPASRVFWSALAAVVGLVALESVYWPQRYYLFRPTQFQGPVAVGLALLIWSLWVLPADHPAVRFLRWRPWVYLGELSYGLYLVHLPSFGILAALQGAVAWLRPVPTVIGTFVISVTLALALHYAVERPANALKRLFPYEPAPSRES